MISGLFEHGVVVKIGNALAFKDRVHPALVIQIPTHRFANALLEFMGGSPAEIVLNFRGVDRVAAIVARPIFHEGD